jgi:pimeloyl-ACP methyl ester carboxylesterase
MKRLVYLVLVLAASTAAARAAPDVTGHWLGTMQRGSSALTVSFDFSPGQPKRGAFTAGDLGAMDVPLAKLRVEPTIHWELVGDRTTTVFDGTLNGGTIRGTFHEDQSRGTFSLRRVSSSVTKPYVETNVRFANGAVTLAGTMLAPRAAGRYPAVVLTPGSGAEGRWASHFLADYVARHGVVALIYDKRGVGESTGDWRASTLADLADDARAAVHVLADRAGVDRRNVGYFGHSQGAYIAPLVARDNPDVRWIIAADGNVGPQYRQDLFRVGTSLRKRYTGDDLANAMTLYREFVDVARNGLPHTQFRADEARFKNAAWLDDLALPDDQNWIWSWYRQVGNFDNSAAWQSTGVPVLLVYGQRDEVVPVTESIDAIRALLVSRHNDPTVRIFASADHTLHIPPSAPDGWPHNAPGFPAILVDWIKAH